MTEYTNIIPEYIYNLYTIGNHKEVNSIHTVKVKTSQCIIDTYNARVQNADYEEKSVSKFGIWYWTLLRPTTTSYYIT